MSNNVKQILLTILIFIVIFAVVHFSLQSHVIDGDSMEPDLHDGQYVLLNKLAYYFGDPARGEIIVFNPPIQSADPYIKRIIGLPGDKVVIEEGKVYINSVELKETPSFDPLPEGDSCSIVVPEDRYFVLGDNRAHSNDSPNWGSTAEAMTVPRDNIFGKVWIFYWPPSEWGLSPNYSWSLD